MLKASFLFTVDYKSRKLKSKLHMSLAANKFRSVTQRIYIRGKKLISPFESLTSERKHKVQGWLPHTVQNKCRPSFPGNWNIINKKINSKNQQSGDDYTTLSTTTKITTGKPWPYIRWRKFFFFVFFFFFTSWLLGHETVEGGGSVCGAVSVRIWVSWWCVCESLRRVLQLCVSICVVLVSEGGVVPLQLLLSAGPLLVLRLAALLIFAALWLSTRDVIFLLSILALLLLFLLLLAAMLVLVRLR